MIQHVWERCQLAQHLDATIIATDDERIAAAANSFGAKVAMTSPDHASGTDRIAEAAASDPDCTHIINIQGDEPLIDPALIDQLAGALLGDPEVEMITAAVPAAAEDDLTDPNIVKTVLNKCGEALYFSRSLIPHQIDQTIVAPRYRHMGIYGYTKKFLLRFVGWEPSPLELAERLEQLRALENGARIKAIVTTDASIGVDTPAQAAMVEQLILANR
jgi:3-deoxy-manno-octulosonate cytidylyltransferase (CMP-KDO synthetase)